MPVIAQRRIAGPSKDGTWLVADAKLELLGGNARPHFSLTGEEWKSEKHKRNDWERSGLYSCGAMGNQLAAVWPELDLINQLHLADDTGEPMHAEANGWYAYSGDWHKHDAESAYSQPRTDTPHELAASILRIQPDELPHGMNREAFSAFVDTLRERWKAEADAAIAWLKRSA